MNNHPLGPGVSTYGVPEKYSPFCRNKPGWWFYHHDGHAQTVDLIRVEARGQRFTATVVPVDYGLMADKLVLGTYPTIDAAHQAGLTVIATRNSPRLTRPADIDAVRGLFPDATPTARFK